jgi:hypothetical protein
MAREKFKDQKILILNVGLATTVKKHIILQVGTNNKGINYGRASPGKTPLS